MKKNFIFAASAAALLMMGACTGNNCRSNACGNPRGEDAKEVFSGILPAADADGVRYTLTLDYDDDNPNKGDYDLMEIYEKEDSISGHARDIKSIRSEGDFKVINEKANKYLLLTPDMKDSDRAASAEPLYFLMESDSTIVLVNKDLQRSENPDLNYTLNRL